MVSSTLASAQRLLELPPLQRFHGGGHNLRPLDSLEEIKGCVGNGGAALHEEEEVTGLELEYQTDGGGSALGSLSLDPVVVVVDGGGGAGGGGSGSDSGSGGRWRGCPAMVGQWIGIFLNCLQKSFPRDI